MIDDRVDPTGVSFELTIAFHDAESKKEVLSWLEAQGIHDIVEGIIDGVDLIAPEDSDVAAASLMSLDDKTPVALYRSKAQLEELVVRLNQLFSTRIQVQISALPNTAWQQAWQTESEYEGLVTRRLRVLLGQKPSGYIASGKIDIFIERGSAFGDGRHATTQVALELLDHYCDLSRRTILDVGTGNGILAIAAACLGVESVLATEIDQAALAEAQFNARLNHVGDKIEFTLMDRLPERRKFDVICANILVPVLHELMPQFAEALSVGGQLLLAGFIEKDEQALLTRASANHLQVQHRANVRGWSGLVLQHI